MSYLKHSVVTFVMMTMWIGLSDLWATSQWTRKTGMPCTACHTVFPRLNSYGEAFLRNGYQIIKSREDKKDGEEGDEDKVVLHRVSNLLGFRLNLTPIAIETNSFQKDSGSAKSSRFTIGNPIWIQFFAAGSIYKDISFFSELEYQKSSFKFNWFYFNFTNLAGSRYANLQVGNISPLEFASYPNRLPQLPNIKGEVFLVKSSGGNGEESIDMSSARTGIQYYGYNDYGLLYFGVSPGTVGTTGVTTAGKTTSNQFIDYWGGLVFQLSDEWSDKFAGSTATIHYYSGTDSKNSGDETTNTTAQQQQIKNEFTRISPQVNIRYDEKVDLQAAYVIGKDKNRDFVVSGAKDFDYRGVAFEGGYMPSWKWHFGLHYDKFRSSNRGTDGKRILDYQRVVPTATYVINQNIRFTLYYEKDLTNTNKTANKDQVDRLLCNIRVMF